MATNGDPNHELDALLAAAAAADPGTRIEYRDRLARQGAAAIQGMTDWFRDARLGAFAIRVAEHAAAYGARDQAIQALRDAAQHGATERIVADASEALGRLAPSTVRRRSSSATKPRAHRTPTMAPEDLIVDRVYKRRELHNAGLGGNWQTGISYPSGGSYALIFSDPDKGREHGYKDHWEGDEYHYYGQWIGEGDMVFELGNRAIVELGEELYLLIAAAGGYRFAGRFRLGRHYVATTERDGKQARALVFVLERAGT